MRALGTRALGARGAAQGAQHIAGAQGLAQGSEGRAGWARGRRWARGRDTHRRAAVARGTGAGRAAWACCWAVGCALGALSLFLTRFDSVLFLSQFLDIVREPGS